MGRSINLALCWGEWEGDVGSLDRVYFAGYRGRHRDGAPFPLYGLGPWGEDWGCGQPPNRPLCFGAEVLPFRSLWPTVPLFSCHVMDAISV